MSTKAGFYLSPLLLPREALGDIITTSSAPQVWMMSPRILTLHSSVHFGLRYSSFDTRFVTHTRKVQSPQHSSLFMCSPPPEECKCREDSSSHRMTTYSVLQRYRTPKGRPQFQAESLFTINDEPRWVTCVSKRRPPSIHPVIHPSLTGKCLGGWRTQLEAVACILPCVFDSLYHEVPSKPNTEVVRPIRSILFSWFPFSRVPPSSPLQTRQRILQTVKCEGLNVHFSKLNPSSYMPLRSAAELNHDCCYKLADDNKPLE